MPRGGALHAHTPTPSTHVHQSDVPWFASQPANMTDSVWGKPQGAWADDVDEQEQSGNLAAPTVPMGKEDAFPSLAAAAKEPAGKKKKAKAVPLGAFLGGSASAAARSAVDEKSILLSLPKGSSGLPKEERESGGLGGAPLGLKG